MARNQSALVNWSQYLALRGVTTLAQCFPPEANLRTANAVGSWYFRRVRRHRERAMANLSRSFPELPRADVRRIAEQSIQHMFKLFMVDAMVSPRLVTPDTWPQYVRFGETGDVIDVLLARRPTILITGHAGNWEVLGTLFGIFGFPVNALARPIDNPLINRWVMTMREVRGTKIITKWGATPVVQEILRDGGRIGFIADQNAGDNGMFVPFFGRLASSYKSIALLSLRYNAPIVCGMARRLGDRFRFCLEVTDIIEPDEAREEPDPIFYITARYNRAMEMMIRPSPEQYLWVHRRWKSRPPHEREGQPFPTRLKKKLEALPWMTRTDFDRILANSEEDARSIHKK